MTRHSVLFSLSICMLLAASVSVFAQFPGGGPPGGKRGGMGGPPSLPEAPEPPEDLYDPAVVAANALSPFGVDNPFVKMGMIFKWNGEEGRQIMKTLGAGWVMPSPLFGINRQLMDKGGEYDFHRHDAYVRYAQALNIQILFIVGTLEPGGPPPRRGPNGAGPGAPKDMEAFSKFVQAVVERYDGDGVDDMPGLRYPVRYWMALDEPFFKRYWSGTAEEYLKVYLAMYNAAKAADPNSVPVLSSLYTPYESDTQDFAKEFIRLYLDAIRHGEASKHIDALDYHWICKMGADEGYKKYRDGMEWQKKSFAKGGVDIGEWTCTETCMLTEDRDLLRQDIVKRYALARSLSIAKIFWSSLVSADPSRDPFTAISLKVTENDPMLDTYRVMASMMGSGPCALTREHGISTVTCENGVAVVWAESDTDWTPSAVATSPDGHLPTYFDLGGNSIPAPTRLTPSPIYIKP